MSITTPTMQQNAEHLDLICSNGKPACIEEFPRIVTTSLVTPIHLLLVTPHL
jgi:hypothetical protein